MRSTQLLFRTAATLAILALVAACSDDSGPVSPFGPVFTDVSNGDPVEEYVTVWKFNQDGTGTFDFQASATGGNLLFPAFQLDHGEARLIWFQSDPAADLADVTVTEVLTPGMQVDSIRYYFTDDPDTWYTLIGTNTITVDVNAFRGARIKFYNSGTPGNGFEGCTPGFWRQAQHFQYWTAPYTPSDLFNDVFAPTTAFPTRTLLNVVWLGGGGINALGRHAVAALLNAASPSVDYPLTVQEVIDAFNAAVASGNFEAQKDVFEGYNEANCPF